MGKLARARRLLASNGLQGVLQAFREQAVISRTESFLRYWTTQHDYVWIGRLATAVTETVLVEGQRFMAPRELVSHVLRCRFLLVATSAPSATCCGDIWIRPGPSSSSVRGWASLPA